MKDYPESIKKPVAALCDEIKKYYPEIFEQRYNSYGKPVEDGRATFQERMEMGVYIELIKAGAIRD